MNKAIARVETLIAAKDYTSASQELGALKNSSLARSQLNQGGLKPNDHFSIQCLEVRILLGLGSLKEAKIICQQIVRLFPRSIDGYQLLGRVYRSLGQFEKLDRLYTLAIKRVESKGEKTSLRSIIDDKSPLTATKTRHNDPFQRLPKEVVLCILQFCQFQTPELVQCLSVCRFWREFLENEPTLWSNLDLSMAAHTAGSASTRKRVRVSTVALPTIERYCSLSGSNLNINLTNTQLQQPIGKVLVHLFNRHSGKLRSLILIDDSLASPMDIYKPVPTLFILRSLLPRSLEAPQLRTLAIASSDPVSDIQWALAKFPQLESLSFQVTSATAARSDDVEISPDCQLKSVCLTSADDLSLPFRLLECICSLKNVESVLLNRVFVSHEAISSLLSNRHLKALHFVSSRSHTSSPVLVIPQSTEKMRQLVLGRVKLYIPPVVTSQLTSLKLFNCEIVSSSLAEAIAAFRPEEHLSTLVINNTTFRGSDLIAATPFPKVHSLQLTSLPELNRQLVLWLKEVFPNVDNLNVDDSMISAPNLVDWIKNSSVKVLRCRNCSLSVNTMLWLKKINIKAVYT